MLDNGLSYYFVCFDQIAFNLTALLDQFKLDILDVGINNIILSMVCTILFLLFLLAVGMLYLQLKYLLIGLITSRFATITTLSNYNVGYHTVYWIHYGCYGL